MSRKTLQIGKNDMINKMLSVWRMVWTSNCQSKSGQKRSKFWISKKDGRHLPCSDYQTRFAMVGPIKYWYHYCTQSHAKVGTVNRYDSELHAQLNPIPKPKSTDSNADPVRSNNTYLNVYEILNINMAILNRLKVHRLQAG